MKKWFLPLFAVLAIGLLAGCGEQVESLLEKANQILDQQLEKDDSEETSGGKIDETESNESEGQETGSNTENEDKEKGEKVEDNPKDNSTVVKDDGQGHGPDDGQTFTVEELIKRGEYESIDPPNGYPLSLPPADWRLVQIIKDPEDGHEAWEGVFCFDTELQSTISSYEEQLFNDGFSVISEPIDSDDVPDAKHSTKFQYTNDPNVTLEGDMNYYIDKYGNSCTKVYFTF